MARAEIPARGSARALPTAGAPARVRVRAAGAIAAATTAATTGPGF